MDSGRLVVFASIIFVMISSLNGRAEDEPFLHIWEVQIPVMAHLAVSMDGTL